MNTYWKLLTTFETIRDNPGQPGTIWDTPGTTLDNILDNSGHPGTAWDNLGQPETTRNNLGQLLTTIDTIQDNLGQPGTHSFAYLVEMFFQVS